MMKWIVRSSVTGNASIARFLNPMDFFLKSSLKMATASFQVASSTPARPGAEMRITANMLSAALRIKNLRFDE